MLVRRMMLLGTVVLMMVLVTALSGVALAQPVSNAADRQCLELAARTVGFSADLNPANTTFIGGTEGEDDFTGKGTEGHEVFCGFGGSDRIDTLDNGDVLLGGAGNDGVRDNFGTYYGGEGGDEVALTNYGTFYGGAGDDRVLFNFGTFYGGEGNDRVVGANIGIIDSVEIIG